MVSVEQLKALKIFKEASPLALERLANDIVERKFGPGETILKEGQLSGALYLIAAGSVMVEKQLDKEGGRSKVVARLEAEEFFGEMSFLENQPHSATIVAQSETRLFVLPRQALDNMMSKDSRLALDQVLTLLSAVSSRLRRTTRELVTVFEVARLMGQSGAVHELMTQVVGQLCSSFGDRVSVGFYRWNPFNNEYALLSSKGHKSEFFVPVIEEGTPLLRENAPLVSIPDLSQHAASLEPLRNLSGHLVLSKMDMLQIHEGLFLYLSQDPLTFDSGDKQMIETVSAVLAPALATARGREEEIARLRLEQSRQQRYFS